jgi:O-antigen ligase
MDSSIHRTYITSKGLLYFGLVAISIALAAALVLFPDNSFIPIAVVLGILWVVTSLTRPMIGLYGFAIFILVRPNEFIPFLALPHLEKIIVAPVLIGLAFRMVRQSAYKFNLNNIDKLVALFVVITLMSVGTSIWAKEAMKNWFIIWRLFLIYVLVVSLIDTEKLLRSFIMICILTTGFHVVTATVNYYRGPIWFEMGIDRAMGLDTSYGAPNALAATIAYTLPFMSQYIKSTHTKLRKYLLVGLFVVSIWCIIITGSRTGMAAVILFTFLVVLQGRNRVRNTLIGAMLLLVAYVAMPGQYRARFASTTDFSSQTGAAMSAQGRVDGLVNGAKMLLDRPLLGVGIGLYGLAWEQMTGTRAMAAHSLPGQVMGDLGTLGVIAFVAWIVALFRGLGKLARYYLTVGEGNSYVYNMVVALRMQLILLLFMGIGGHNLYRYNWYFISALVSAMLGYTFIRQAVRKRSTLTKLVTST